jgi:hypothetical protein
LHWPLLVKTSLHFIESGSQLKPNSRFSALESKVESCLEEISSKVKQRLPQQTKGSKVLSSCVIRYDQKNHQRPILQTIREFYKPLKTDSTNHRSILQTIKDLFYKPSSILQTIRVFYTNHQSILHTNHYKPILRNFTRYTYVCKSCEAVFTTKRYLCILINNKNSAIAIYKNTNAN